MGDQQKARLGFKWLAMIGPGILIAATGVGAGDLATAAFSGNQLGMAVLWAVLVGTGCKFVLNEGLARYQLATGESILQGAVTRLGPAVKWVFGGYLLLWSYFVASSLMSGCGVAMQAIWPVFEDPSRGQWVFGMIHSLVGIALVRIGGFSLFEKVMCACALVMFLVVLVTAILLRPDIGEMARGMFVPSIPDAANGGLAWTIALIGGIGGTLTVVCYGYWIREKGREGPGALTTCRVDLGAGYLVTAIFGIAMVVIGTQIEVQGKGATLIVDLANRLEEPLGPIGRWMFLIGTWGAIFSSLLGVWQAVPYVFADFMGLLSTRKGEAHPPVRTDSPAYRSYLYALGLIPMLGLHIPFKEIQKVYAIFGAAFMPLLALTLLLLCGRSLPQPEMRNRWTTNVLLGAILVFFCWAGYFGIRKTFA